MLKCADEWGKSGCAYLGIVVNLFAIETVNENKLR